MSDEEEEGHSIGMIIGVVLAPIVIMAAGIAFIFIIMKNRNAKKKITDAP